jgi:hypothetical protein
MAGPKGPLTAPSNSRGRAQCALGWSDTRQGNHTGERKKAMPEIEQIELVARVKLLNRDVKHLVEKYRAIFEWDIPDIDEALSDRLIFAAVRKALDTIEQDPGG